MENSVVLTACRILTSIKGIKLTVTPFVPKKPSSTKKLVANFAKHHQCSLSLNTLPWSKLTDKHLPLAFKSPNGQLHILAKLSGQQALIQDVDDADASKAPKVLSSDELKALWSGTVIRFKKGGNTFDIRWFIPEFIRFRKLLSEVIILSLFIQLMALILPLFFQVIMDKVLTHQTLATLDVLVIVLVLVGMFEVVLTGLREYVLAHTTTRIDIRLGAKLFHHLLNLPIGYFKSRQVGAIVTRVRELDSIRDLLTGASLLLIVDVTFTFVFFAVMYYLSPILTYIALAAIPFYFLIAALSSKPLHARIIEKFQKTAQNTAFLTESIQGAETLKSLALEPRFSNRWEQQSKALADANFNYQTIQTLSTQAVDLLQKVTSVTVIIVGAGLVMNLSLTIGQLIAFNMMVSHVAQPMGKLVSLWQQFIQTRVAVDNLGDMLNMPTEKSQGQVQPKEGLKGDIEFNQVSFRYGCDQPYVLKNLNLVIRQGEHVGIVGPSGSGKSTLTRLIQKLYLPSSGEILVNKHSLNTLSASYFRRHLGVVLQENQLFNRTVRENISLRMPTTSFSRVEQAAKLAGAHNFILKLPMGYDTVLSEGGDSLSGGQRQRIAIARALLTSPDLLIFDEATSALDEESQQIVQSNLKHITKGRTVITIAHRLSTVEHCDRILVIENGELTEQGTHQQLITSNGCYQRLWTLQANVMQEAG